MSKILHWRFVGLLSLMLAFVMVLPIAVAAGSIAESAKPVVISNEPGKCKISIGKGEDARVGTKGVISRDGKDISKFEVTSVEWGYAIVRLTDTNEKLPVMVGDSVSLTEVPTPTKIKSGGAGKTLGFLLFVGALVALGSGSKGGGGHGGSSGANSLSVQAHDTSLPADGSSTTLITVTVVDSKNASVPDGTPVTFAATAGAITPASTVTTGGQATATLTAGDTQGSCLITATSGSKTGTTTVSFLPSDAGTKGSIVLAASANPIQVLNSGGALTESTITATCRNSQGGLVTSGTVTFTSTIGSVIGTADINGSGQATTTFSSSQTGEATITATWSGAEASMTVNVTAGPPHSIQTTCLPTAVECDGNSFATVTVTVKDIAGNSVTDGTIVDFTVLPDVNGGGNGTVTPETRTTNGQTTALLFSRDSAGNTSQSGTATVVATIARSKQLAAGIPAPATDISNHETQVIFTSLDVSSIHVGANPLNIRGWDFVGRTTTITALVKDANNNPVPNGTAVYFTANHGMIYGNGGTSGDVAMSTTTLGQATATLVSDASGDGSWNGMVDVTATSGDVTLTVPNLVIFSGPPIFANCTLDVNPASIEACQDSTTIVIQALDINGNPVVNDTDVTIAATKGTLSSTTARTVNGVVIVTLSTSADCANKTTAGPGLITVTIDSGGTGLPVTLTAPYTIAGP